MLIDLMLCGDGKFLEEPTDKNGILRICNEMRDFGKTLRWG